MSISLIIYFAVILALGLSQKHHAQPKDFFAAGHSRPIPAVTLSLLATILGSSAILGTISWAASVGWASLWMLFSASIGLICLIPLAGRIQEFRKFTLPELLGEFYGIETQKIACFFIPIAWLGVIAAQVIGAGQILSSACNLSYVQAAILSGAVFLTYTFIGGQLSIIKTDIWQGLCTIAGILLATFLLFQKVSGHETMSSMPFPFNSSFSFPDLLILLLTYATPFLVGPDIYSRLFCAKDARTAKISTLLTAIILIPIAFCLSLIGVLSCSLMNTGGLTGFMLLLKTHLPGWAWITVTLALISAVMSSADTTLLTASATFSELFVNLKENHSVRLTRFMIILFGSLATTIALFIGNIIQSLLLAFSFFSGGVIIPTLAGLLGFRTEKNRAIAAILSGGSLSFIGKILTLNDMPEAGNTLIVLAFLINALLLFIKFPTKKP